MSGRLAIYGAGGHGRVAAEAALSSREWEQVVFFDDAWPARQASGPWPIVGDWQALLADLAGQDGVLVAIGDNATRLARLETLAGAGARLASIVHPAATVSAYADIGRGVVIFAGAVVQIGSRLETGVIVNTGATIDHDCVLEAGVHVSPGAHLAGAVHVGQASWIGIGAVVRQQLRIGAHAMVAAGAVVVGDVADQAKIAGVPARLMNIQG